MLKEYFEKRKRVLLGRAVGVAITLVVIGLITGKLTESNWFIGVFILTNLVMGLVDWFLAKSGKSAR